MSINCRCRCEEFQIKGDCSHKHSSCSVFPDGKNRSVVALKDGE